MTRAPEAAACAQAASSSGASRPRRRAWGARKKQVTDQTFSPGGRAITRDASTAAWSSLGAIEHQPTASAPS
jgi:hypothetical protein